MGRLDGRRTWGRISRLVLAVLCYLYLGQSAPAACPSADLSGDCFVDLEDFALLAALWPASDFNDIAEMSAHWLAPDPRITDYMAYIDGGTFQMGDSFSEGSSFERPVHTVTLDSFYIAKYELTNGQYCDYLNSALSLGLITVADGNVYQPGSGTSFPYCDTHIASAESQIDYSGGIFSVRAKSGRDMSNDPMVMVSWYGAAAYCNWRSEEEGYEQCYDLSTWTCDFSKKGYRLPTEAEWEYAARGGLSGKRFPWGDEIFHTQANYWSSPLLSYDKGPTAGHHWLWNDVYPCTSPVGFFDGAMKYKADYNWPSALTSYQTKSGANNYGLYDMAGNVYEWCNDFFSGVYYSSSPVDNPTGPTSGVPRAYRGGVWWYPANYCRVANRFNTLPDLCDWLFGFRVVLSD